MENAGSGLAAKLATSIRWPVLKEALEQDRAFGYAAPKLVGRRADNLTAAAPIVIDCQ
jgi:hypothetical protein